MIIKSLQKRIVFFVIFLLISISITLFFVTQFQTEKEILNLQLKHAKNIVNTVVLSVENEYNSILFHRTVLLNERKKQLIDVMDITFFILKKYYSYYKAGKMSLKKAQAEALKEISKFRYDNGVGYIWINDCMQPIPKMLMHPTLPELNNKILNDKKFYSAYGKKINLFQAAVEVCLKSGEGIINYLWPKPIKNKLTQEQPKISYVKLFKPWKWILGTGLYIDDIEKGKIKRFEAAIQDLKKSFSKTKILKNGYLFLFTGKKELLIHPDLKSLEIRLKSQKSGDDILGKLITASQTQEKTLEYFWNKPVDPDLSNRYKKLAYVIHFKPLDWYIVSSIYLDEIKNTTYNLRIKMIFLMIVFIVLSSIISYFLTKSIIKPLKLLCDAAINIKEKGITRDTINEIPLKGTTEIIYLSQLLRDMIESIDEKNNQLKNFNLHLGELVYKRTKELEDLNHIQYQFFASISHEIRTPLNSIISFNEQFLEGYIGETEIDNEQKETVKMILKSAYYLLDLINNVLDISKIESTKFEINFSKTDILKIVKSALSITNTLLRREEKQDKIQIVNRIQESFFVYCDSDKTLQILINLISNAIKYTEEGVIEITQEIKENFLIICVKDTGIGIPEENLKNIFKKYYQVKSSRVKKIKSTGLGLAIAKKLVALQRGKIWVESKLNKGSAFYFTVPIKENMTKF